MFLIALSVFLYFFLHSAEAFIPNRSSHTFSTTPIMKFIHVPPITKNTHLGEPLKLDVSLATTSVVECEWLKNGDLISLSAEAAEANLKRDIYFTSMIITSNLTVGCPQDGVYTFKCTNGLETIESHTFVQTDIDAQLHCKHPESPLILTYSDFLMARVGEAAVLFCESSKIGSFMWSKNNKPIYSDRKYEIGAGTLTIKNLGFEDKDEYKCSIITADGVDSRNLTLLTVG
ncbi:unnamed protein product [Caenorhabditis brenneri]